MTTEQLWTPGVWAEFSDALMFAENKMGGGLARVSLTEGPKGQGILVELGPVRVITFPGNGEVLKKQDIRVTAVAVRVVASRLALDSGVVRS